MEYSPFCDVWYFYGRFIPHVDNICYFCNCNLDGCQWVPTSFNIGVQQRLKACGCRYYDTNQNINNNIMDLLQQIVERAKADKQRIVLPEALEERTLRAADRVLADDIADIILIGNPMRFTKWQKRER